MFPFTRYFPMDCWQSLKLLSHQTCFFLFLFVWNYSSFPFMKTDNLPLLQIPSGPYKIMQKVWPSPLYPVVCCFLYPAEALGKTFSNIPYLRSKTNVKLCPRSVFEPQSLGTDSRQAFLICKEWQQPFGMNLWHSMPACSLVFVALLTVLRRAVSFT